MVEESLAESKVAKARSMRGNAIKAAAALLVALLLVLLVWATLAAGRGESFVSQITAGKRPPSPNFKLPVIYPNAATWPSALRAKTADGSLSLADLRGEVAVINFYASWCVTCRDEAPYLRATAEQYAGKVAFIGLDVQDLESDGIGFAKRYRFDYPALRDSDGSIYRAFGLTGVPETFYLDRKGRVVAHSPGGVETAGLRAGIRAALQSH